MEREIDKLFDEAVNINIYRMYCPDADVYPRVIAFGDISDIDGDYNEYGSGLFRLTLEIYCKKNFKETKKEMLKIISNLEYTVESETDIQGDDIYHMQIICSKHIIYEN